MDRQVIFSLKTRHQLLCLISLFHTAKRGSRRQGQLKTAFVTYLFISGLWKTELMKKSLVKIWHRLVGVLVRNKYLLLTEFEAIRTASYGPSLFPLIYGPSAKRAGHNSTRKNEDPYLKEGPRKGGQ